MEIPVVKGLEEIGNPHINEGKANFIQVYINKIPYFRASSEKKNHKLLEELLIESGIEFKTERKSEIFHPIDIPLKKGKNYELVGEGIIGEAYPITKNIQELGSQEYFAISSYFKEYYMLYPSIEHLSKIIDHFNHPLIFVDSNYYTKEEIEFIHEDHFLECGPSNENNNPEDDLPF